MTSLRYGLHFTALAVATVIFWMLRNVYPHALTSGFDFFHFPLMGTLHATSIVVSLRTRRTVNPLWPFPVCILVFVFFASALSALTPFMALAGSFVWLPFDEILGKYNLGPDAIFLTGSAIGAAAYWLLVRLFLMKALRPADLFRTVVLCVIATLSVEIAFRILDGFTRSLRHVDANLFDPIITVAWWFAFSIALYWCDMSERTLLSAQVAQTVT